MWINKCFENLGDNQNKVYYDSFFMNFPSDYDRENPVTKNEGFMRLLDFKI